MRVKKALTRATNAAVVITATALSFASPAHADSPAAFGERNYQAICNLVAQEPTPHGIWAANSILLSEQMDLNYGQMQTAIGIAIRNHCSRYSAIYSAYRSRYP